MSMPSIIIFGGSKGIGKMLAAYYNNKNFKVTTASRGSGQGIKADVTSPDDVEAVFKAHDQKFGAVADMVINTAGIQGPIGNTWELPMAKIDAALKVNLLGSFIVAATAVRWMKKRGHGSIIMFSGGGAAYGRAGFNAYAASKSGVLRMVEGMADELQQAGLGGITINAIAPGAVKTGMTAAILKAGKKAGKKDLAQALKVNKSGGTSIGVIGQLTDFLLDPRRHRGLTGRLIHVRDDYQAFVKGSGLKIAADRGKLRRVPLSV